LEITSDHTGAIVGFKLKNKETVYAKIASSFISFEQAELNLKREIGNRNFDQVKTDAKNIWNKTLGKIEVKGGTDQQMRTFYSSLYRTLFFHRNYMRLMLRIK
jgi:putative alpha-1,2-mannosidase